MVQPDAGLNPPPDPGSRCDRPRPPTPPGGRARGPSGSGRSRPPAASVTSHRPPRSPAPPLQATPGRGLRFPTARPAPAAARTTASMVAQGAAADAGRRSARRLAVVLTQELRLQVEDVVEHPVDAPALQAVVGDQPPGAEQMAQPVGQRAVHADLAGGQGVLQELEAEIEGPHPVPFDAVPRRTHVPRTSTRPSSRTRTLTRGSAGRG